MKVLYATATASPSCYIAAMMSARISAGRNTWKHCEDRSMDANKLIGKLTPEETVELLQEIVQFLPDTLLIDTLSKCLTMEQIDELTERLP